MKNIRIGSTYIVRFHDGFLTPATVLRLENEPAPHWFGTAPRITARYSCRNESTGRLITVKSAVRFRYEVTRFPDGSWQPPARCASDERAILTLQALWRTIPMDSGFDWEPGERIDARAMLARAAFWLRKENEP